MAKYNIRNYKLVSFLNVLNKSVFKIFEILVKHYKFYHKKTNYIKKNKSFFKIWNILYNYKLFKIILKWIV